MVTYTEELARVHADTTEQIQRQGWAKVPSEDWDLLARLLEAEESKTSR